MEENGQREEVFPRATRVLYLRPQAGVAYSLERSVYPMKDSSLPCQDEAHDIDIERLRQQLEEEYRSVCELTFRHVHGLDIFREGYQQLYEEAMTSLDSTMFARQRIDQLVAELNEHRGKLGKLETYEEDAKNSKLNLLAVLEKTQQLGLELQNRQAQKLETAAKLRTKIEETSKRIAAGPGWTPEQEETRTMLLAEAGELQREIEVKQRNHIALRSDVGAITLHVEQEQENLRLSRETVASFEARAEAIQKKNKSELNRKGHLEKLLVANQKKVKSSQEACQSQRRRLNMETKSINMVEHQLRGTKEEVERCLSEYDELFRTIQRLSEELETQTIANSAIQEENANKKQTAKAVMVKLGEVEKETRKTIKLKALAQKKIDEGEDNRQEYEKKRDKLKAEIQELKSLELMAGQKSIAALKRQIEELKRENDILDRKQHSSNRAASMIFDLIKVNQSTLKNLSNDRKAIKCSIRELRSRIEQIMVQRERAEKDFTESTQLWQERTEELNTQEAQVAELREKISKTLARLKQQQNLYEAVRTDRNIHSKNLIETQDLIKGMKRRFKTMNNQIDQLKDEISAMDSSLVKEHFYHHNVDKDKEHLRNEVTKTRKHIVSGEHIALNQRSELQKLNLIVEEATEERQRQVKEHDAIVSEKRVLLSQLMKRNEELGALYDKIRIQTSSLYQGEVLYQKLLSIIRDLEAKVKSLEIEVVQSRSQASDLSEFTKTSNKLEKDLKRERLKITALVEELELPINVHRWRKLETSDPERYDLVMEVRSLQRVLIAKSDSVVKKGLLIQEKEKLYIELKNILGRQPGPEVAEQLATYQESLKHKLKQMKAMEEELEMYREQVDLFKSDIEATNEAMRSLCHKWVMGQRRGGSFRQEASDGAENSNGASGGWNSPVSSASPIVDERMPAPFEGSITSNGTRDE